MVLVPICIAFHVKRKSNTVIFFLHWIYQIGFIKRKFRSFNKFENSVFKQIREFVKENIFFLKDKVLVAEQMIIELFALLLEFLKIYLLFLAVGINTSFIIVGVVTILAETIGFLFFTPGGLGTVEGTMVGLYYLFGIIPELAVAVVIVNRVVLYVYQFLFGYTALVYLRHRLGRFKL